MIDAIVKKTCFWWNLTRIMQGGTEEMNLKGLEVPHGMLGRVLGQQEVHLQRLDLTDCPGITGRSIHAMAPCMPRLSCLALARCFSSAHEADIAADALTSLPYLAFLDLSQTRVSDAAVSKLLVNLEGLRGLKIASCPSVSNEAFGAKVLASSTLTALDVSGNRNVGPDALRWLDQSENALGDQFGPAETAYSAFQCLNITGLFKENRGAVE